MPIIKRVPDFVEGKTFIIENVLVDFASVFRPNTKYRPEWAAVIRVPDFLRQEFYEVGFRLKQDAQGQVTLRAKRYVRLDDGTEMAPPTIVDCENNPWPESRGLIGNGSLCNVKVRAKYTEYQGVEGLSCFLEGLQVLEHVPYSGGTDFAPAQGSTGGYAGQNFQQQPPAQQGYGQQPPPQAPPQPVPQAPGVNPYGGDQQAQAPAAPQFGQQPQAGGFVQPTQPPAQAPAFAPPAPHQAPAFAQPPAPPAPAAGAYVPPGTQPQAPQSQAYVPPGAQPQAPPAPPAQAPPSHIPQGVPQGIPQGAPPAGNVSQPEGALAYGQPTAPPTQEEQGGQTDWAPSHPSQTNTGDDVPF